MKSLTSVISVRVVSRPGGGVDEVHVLTTTEVTPKQTVRNVESALLAQFDLAVDHRKISVAQTTAVPEEPSEPVELEEIVPISARRTMGRPDRAPRSFDPFDEPVPPVATELAPEPQPVEPPVQRAEAKSLPEGRILFLGHSIESLRSQRLNMKVALEWRGKKLVGEASGADLARSRLEGFASATLHAVEAALDPTLPEDEREQIALTLDGVQTVEVFDRQFVLVAVSALLGQKITHLTGAAAVEDSGDRAVILATLQATDRRVRAFLEGFTTDSDAVEPEAEDSASDSDNPFEVWA